MKTFNSNVRLAILLAGILAIPAITQAASDLPPIPGDTTTSSATDLPKVQILATDGSALLGISTAAFTAVREGGTAADLTIHFIVSGTASNGLDYTTIADTLTIPANAMAVDIPVQPLVVAGRRGNKTVTLTVETNAAYQIVTHKKATVTIVDDVYNDLPPLVTLKTPADGEVIGTPGVVALLAEASDPDDIVKSVSFYANDLFLGRATNSPYSLNWTNPAPGSYALFARATDSFGKSTLSPSVQISVTNAPPTIKLLSPADGATFGAPANIAIKAEFADSDDGVRRAKIYGDGHLLGTFTNSPVSLTWSNVSAGKHLIYASVTDLVGLGATAHAYVTVTNIPTEVSIVAPADGANLNISDTIMFQAEVKNAENNTVKVSFYVDGRLVGTDTKNPYSVVWKHATIGYHSLKAVATDKGHEQATSKTIHFSVSK